MELNYKDSLSAVLANNRSEHIGMDVWDEFVLPYFYKKIDFNSSLPLRIEGGRGSGKTMLLRYLSYHSRFSEKRKNTNQRARGDRHLFKSRYAIFKAITKAWH